MLSEFQPWNKEIQDEFQRTVLVQVSKAAAIEMNPEFSMGTRNGLIALKQTNKQMIS